MSAARDEAMSFADDGYGSLMGVGGTKKKKKPVLVLDPEELEKAHNAIAMGGAQIMEAEDQPEALERVRQPSSMLGLAPMGAEDDEDEADYGFATGSPDEFADKETEALSEEGVSEEEELEDEEPLIQGSLDHLLRPSAERVFDEDDEEAIPSIEEQLKKMRALPIQLDEAAAPFEAEPMQEAAFTPEPEFEDPAGAYAETDVEDEAHIEWTVEEEAEADVTPEHASLEDDAGAIPTEEVRLDIDDWSVPVPDLPEQATSLPEPAWGYESEASDASFDDEAGNEIPVDAEEDAEQRLEQASFAPQTDEAPLSDQGIPVPEESTPESLEDFSWETREVPPEFAQDDTADPVLPEVALPDEHEAGEPFEQHDQWDTEDAEWPQASAPQDPQEDETGTAPELPSEGVHASEPIEMETGFPAEDAEPVVELVTTPQPAFRPEPQNSLRARVQQLEVERQENSRSLLAALWSMLKSLWVRLTGR